LIAHPPSIFYSASLVFFVNLVKMKRVLRVNKETGWNLGIRYSILWQTVNISNATVVTFPLCT